MKAIEQRQTQVRLVIGCVLTLVVSVVALTSKSVPITAMLLSTILVLTGKPSLLAASAALGGRVLQGCKNSTRSRGANPQQGEHTSIVKLPAIHAIKPPPPVCRQATLL
jgi:hypothetical protein